MKTKNEITFVFTKDELKNVLVDHIKNVMRTSHVDGEISSVYFKIKSEEDSSDFSSRLPLSHVLGDTTVTVTVKDKADCDKNMNPDEARR